MGKSTLQALNLKWFGELTNGIGIGISLKDTHPLSIRVDKDRDLRRVVEEALAISIVEILLQHYGDGMNPQTNHVQPTTELWDIITGLKYPLQAVVIVLPRIVNAPSDTKILLSIDDIGRSTVSPAETMTLFQVCAGILLKGRHHPFAYVSFAFDELTDAILFKEKYDINFQPLHPIFLHPGIDESQLPPMLSPFLDQNIKQHLPCNLERTNISKALTSLLIATEGHPTRLSKLLEQLLECPLARPIDGATYLDIVSEWLNKDKITIILAAMNAMNDHRFPTDRLLNLCEARQSFSKSQGEILEDLAFEMTSPNSVEFLLKGHQLHYWSMAAMWSRPILPMTVWKSMPTLSELGPRGVALLKLRDACLECYDVTNPIKDGTTMTKAILAMLMLCCKCTTFFELEKLCHPFHKGWMIPSQVRVEHKIQYWNDIVKFPLTRGMRKFGQTVHRLEVLFDRLLVEDFPGAFFIPAEEPTYIIGVFQSIYDHVVLVIQTKDWHYDDDDVQDGTRLNLEKDWKAFKALEKQTVRCKMRMHPTGIFHSPSCVDEQDQAVVDYFDPPEHRPKKRKLSLNIEGCRDLEDIIEVDVQCIFMVLSVNKDLPSDGDHHYEPNQGAGSLREIKNMLPTAGFALEHAANLQRIFSIN